ncbi:hypothetical protein SGFS_067070 [Streptomyces graminofaciens]|uniref:Integral-membrane protein n=1 Tax=Streptomyces graminofaciens TaxID=68212 RepID=A0ABM7FGL8_9ACTN|nr:hypothetical protein SGFS_067070 [Streptomyces graminofaciens]
MRAAVFAAVCVLLAALGHVTMSGSPVPWWAMAAGAAATGAVGWSLAGRERGLPLIVSVVVTAQTALHSGFSFAQSATTASTTRMTSTTPMAGMPVVDPTHSNHAGSTAAHHMGHMDHTVQVSSMDGMDHAGFLPGGGSSSSGMLAAHLLAALLCGLWLAYGECAAFRLLRAVAGWLAAPLRLPLAVPAAPHRPRRRVSRRSDRAPRQFLLVHAITSRGPPAGTAVS